MRYFVKWRLMLTTLPYVAAVVTAALVRDYVLRAPGWLDFSDVAPVLTAAAFLLGFMLAGVMSDYKESEKLPSDVATTLESIEDAVMTACGVHKDLRLAEMRAEHRALAVTIEDWLFGRTKVDACYAAMKGFLSSVELLDKAASSYATRVLVDLASLRRAVSRIDVIARTTFLQSGFAVLEVLVAIAVLLMLLANFHTVRAEYLIITSISLVYVYMIRLIRDVDDPFRFGPDGPHRGAAEVDLFPLVEYLQRLKAAETEKAPAQRLAFKASATP